jgi:hypothetical protein
MKIKHIRIQHYHGWYKWLQDKTKNNDIRWNYNIETKTYFCNPIYYNYGINSINDVINISLDNSNNRNKCMDILISYNNKKFRYMCTNNYRLDMLIYSIKNNIKHQSVIYRLKRIFGGRYDVGYVMINTLL